LTSYFEDLISETNVWNTFVRIHTRLYKKPLPFFAIGEYYEEEINQQDISFLIWYFMNTIEQEKFISPHNSFFEEIASYVMEVFDDAWDYAPENTYLKSFYKIDKNEVDYYKARSFTDTILFGTYLFYPDTLLDLMEEEALIIEESERDDHLLSLLNANRDEFVHKSHTRLLSLKAKEWVAEIIGESHPRNKDFLSLSQKISGFFLYKGQNDHVIFLEHIASSKKFELLKHSFDHSSRLREVDTIVFIGLVQWRGEWWFSGVFFINSYNADLILDEKNSMTSRMAVNFLDHQVNGVEDTLKAHLESFKAYNHGLQIAFMPSDEIEDFLKGYYIFFNEALNLSKEEIFESDKRLAKEGLFDTKVTNENFSEISDTGLVFFNPKSGVEIALGINSAFPLPENPFFDVEESETHVLRLLMSSEMSKELVLYCLEHCKEDLSFFQKTEGKEYLKDLDFLLRFWKEENYFARQLITSIG
jgi:hypothetical protein